MIRWLFAYRYRHNAPVLPLAASPCDTVVNDSPAMNEYACGISTHANSMIYFVLRRSGNCTFIGFWALLWPHDRVRGKPGFFSFLASNMIQCGRTNASSLDRRGDSACLFLLGVMVMGWKSMIISCH